MPTSVILDEWVVEDGIKQHQPVDDQKDEKQAEVEPAELVGKKLIRKSPHFIPDGRRDPPQPYQQLPY